MWWRWSIKRFTWKSIVSKLCWRSLHCEAFSMTTGAIVPESFNRRRKHRHRWTFWFDSVLVVSRTVEVMKDSTKQKVHRGTSENFSVSRWKWKPQSCFCWIEWWRLSDELRGKSWSNLHACVKASPRWFRRHGQIRNYSQSLLTCCFNLFMKVERRCEGSDWHPLTLTKSGELHQSELAPERNKVLFTKTVSKQHLQHVEVF